jgi:hypothetical protein
MAAFQVPVDFPGRPRVGSRGVLNFLHEVLNSSKLLKRSQVIEL